MPAAMISPVDARLAARMSHRQVETLVMAHEMEHVRDFYRFGFLEYVRFGKRNMGIAELAVQNRSMARIMKGYERLKKPVPKEIIELHEKVMYGEGGIVEQIEFEWERDQ